MAHSCSIDAADHHALWPVLRGANRAKAQGRVATVVKNAPRYGHGRDGQSQLLHIVDRAAIVWLRGVPRLCGAKWACGSKSCCATLTPDPVPPDGMRPCRRCYPEGNQ